MVGLNRIPDVPGGAMCTESRAPWVKFPEMDRHIADLPKFVPQLRGPIMLPDCGHTTQEERPAEVNAAIIDFLRQL